MKSSLRALLTGLIDYAGVFPPARLPLQEAIENYARYRIEEDSWMLGRFIYTAKRLGEIEQYCPKLFSSDRPLTISAVGSGGETCREFLDAAASDLQVITRLQTKQANSARVVVYEARLPDDFFSLDKKAAVGLLEQFNSVFNKNCNTSKRIFFEVGLESDWRARIACATAALTQRNKNNRPEDAFGLKLRCGGLEPAAFPSAEQVVFCLQGCLDHNVPFKATAGLHHPLRHFSQELQTTMHGFVNLFGAGVLAWKYKLNEQEIGSILNDEDAQNFQFTDKAFAWRQWRIPMQEIAAARAQSMISFGSCSFDEPREDLRSLGWA